MLDLKLKYCELMTRYYTHKDDMMGLAKLNHSLYMTPAIQQSDTDWQKPLERVVAFMALAPFDNELSDMMHRVAQDKRLDGMPVFKALTKYYTTQEIVPWPLPEEAELKAHPVFQGDSSISGGGDGKDGGDDDMKGGGEKGDDGEAAAARGEKWFKMLQQRVTEHSIRVVAKYYRRIRLPRLGELLSSTAEAVEDHICRMVSDKFLYAKIDRPAGGATFEKARDQDEQLADWAADLGKVMALVDNTCHVINKEKMMAEAAAKAGGGESKE